MRVVRLQALCHGTLPWTSAQERRALIYRFTPSWFGGGSRMTGSSWESLRDQEAAAAKLLSSGRLSPLQAALMEPAWVGGDPPGEGDGRPDIATLCREAGGAPPAAGSSEADHLFYTISRL